MTEGDLKVLVVEDDFRVARLHAELVASVPGLTVVGMAQSAAHALELAAQHRPDLVLLDEHLPDRRGSELMGDLGAAVILITAETDPGVLRRVVAGGAVNVVLKPFPPHVLTERLTAFVRFWRGLEGAGPVDQRGLDRALGALRGGDAPAGAMPKGRSAVTADAVREALIAAGGALTAQQVAAQTGVSRATAQRYLADLVDGGRVELRLRYGTTGRPEHSYEWKQ